MHAKRIARSFTISLALVGSVLAIPLIRCTATDAEAATHGKAAPVTNTGPCTQDLDKNHPVICINTAGNPDRKTAQAHSSNNGAPVPVVLMGPQGSKLVVTPATSSCPQLTFRADCTDSNGRTCHASTVTTTSGPCTYVATVNGVTGTDPIVDTDTCCPGGPRPKPRTKP